MTLGDVGWRWMMLNDLGDVGWCWMIWVTLDDVEWFGWRWMMLNDLGDVGWCWMTLDQIDWHNSLSIIVQLLNPSGSLIQATLGPVITAWSCDKQFWTCRHVSELQTVVKRAKWISFFRLCTEKWRENPPCCEEKWCLLEDFPCRASVSTCCCSYCEFYCSL